jgi:peptidoglycan/xylan/chitin deacetylase (PgdA/CDA1 family)
MHAKDDRGRASVDARIAGRRLAGAVALAAGLERRSAAGWTAVLFHHLTDQGAWRADSPFVAGLGIAMDKDAFADCMRQLARGYHVIGLSEILATLPGASGNATPSGRTRRRLVICFDDAYKSVVDLAAPVLAELGLPWCFFVNPSLVGNTTLSADNAVAYVANRFGLDPLSRAVGSTVGSVGEFIHGHFTDRTPAERRQLIARLLDDVGADPRQLAGEAKLYVEPGDIRALAAAGVEIGNHTAEHVHCRTLDAVSAREQITDSARAVGELSGRPVRAFAYPYGNHADRTELATAALRTSGHECAFLVHNRMNTSSTDPFGLYRVSLNSADRRLLAAELEIMPRIRAARTTIAGAKRAALQRVRRAA